jgi:hypothetical protein
LLLEIAPQVVELPALIQKYDDPFLPYCRAVFSATGDYVAGYILDLAAFLALGAAGAVAIERAAAILAVTPATLSILHGPFPRADYAQFAAETALRVDGATVTNPEVAAGFAMRGVTGIAVGPKVEAGGDWLDLEQDQSMLASLPFRVVRQSFLNRFKRVDFADALRGAIDAELAAS